MFEIIKEEDAHAGVTPGYDALLTVQLQRPIYRQMRNSAVKRLCGNVAGRLIVYGHPSRGWTTVEGSRVPDAIVNFLNTRTVPDVAP